MSEESRNYDYIVVPLNFSIGEGSSPDTVSIGLQSMINEKAQFGWDVVQVAEIPYWIKPGFLGSILGYRPTMGHMTQVVFKKKVGEP